MKIIDKINEILGIFEESPEARAKWRLDSFRSKWSGPRLTTMINKRTNSMTKRDKVQAWAKELSSGGFKDEAKHAKQKLKSM